jgi:hypothetical protein
LTQIDRLVRLFQGESVVPGGPFDASAAIVELKLRGCGAAVGHKDAGALRLSLEPKFVRECFGQATLRVNGKEVAVPEAGLLLLRQSELTLEETPVLDELISLLRLERVVPRDVSELREVVRKVGLDWAVDFDCADQAPVSDPDLADLVDFTATAPVSDPELAEWFELEVAVSSRQPLEALSKTASFLSGDWQGVVDVIFRFTRAKPTRWQEASHALKEILRSFPESARCLECQGRFSVGEHLLWVSIDGVDRVSVAGSLDPTRPNFGLAWREFHGRGSSPLMTILANDDAEVLRLQLFVTGEPKFNQCLRVVGAGGDMFEVAATDSEELSMLAVAAQFGAVRCTQFLLTSGVKVRAEEVGAAFRGGNADLINGCFGGASFTAALGGIAGCEPAGYGAGSGEVVEYGGISLASRPQDRGLAVPRLSMSVRRSVFMRFVLVRVFRVGVQRVGSSATACSPSHRASGTCVVWWTGVPEGGPRIARHIR